jgi:hypothetical protein
MVGPRCNLYPGSVGLNAEQACLAVGADVADIIGAWIPDTEASQDFDSSSHDRARLPAVLASLSRTMLLEVIPTAAQQLRGEPLSQLLQSASQLLGAPAVTAWTHKQGAEVADKQQLAEAALPAAEVVQAARRICAAGELRLPSTTMRALQRFGDQLALLTAAVQPVPASDEGSRSPEHGTAASQLSFRWVDAPLVAALKAGDWVS